MKYKKHLFIHVTQCCTFNKKNTNKMAYIKYIRMVAESRERGMKIGIKQTNNKSNFLLPDTENITNKNC